MEVAIIKNEWGVVAFSLFPIGVIAWANDERGVLNSVEDNLYDYCNWLNCKLPKEVKPVVKERYVGEIATISFKADDKKLFKKYGEIVLQTAFSFKSMLDSASLSTEDIESVERVFERLSFRKGEGVLERSATILESENFGVAREFIYRIYRLAKELYFSLKGQGKEVIDTFKFDI